MCKYTEKDIPENIRVVVRHFHSGNSSKNKRHGKQMRTIADLLDLKTGLILARGKAECHKGESPSRKIGRQVAIGRALKQLHTGPQ